MALIKGTLGISHGRSSDRIRSGENVVHAFCGGLRIPGLRLQCLQATLHELVGL